MTAIRVRFAPSPTGDLHIGNVRTAVFNWLFARSHGGTFIVRIEDTDAERSTPEAEQSIHDDLQWLGLAEDEGAVRGGPHAPYRQSERRELYRQYAQRLLDAGQAYPCYCREEELEEKKRKLLAKGIQPRYDGACANLTEDRRRAFEAEGRKSSVRFRVGQRDVVFEDLVRGKMSFNCAGFGDFVLLRSDGMAGYNFAAAVDDGLMQISHVIRGEDHLSNTPRQILLCEALGFAPPRYAHLSIIVDKSRAKLKKREPGASFHSLRRGGYLPDAIINYLSLLGWSPREGGEFMTREHLTGQFALDRCGKSPAMFDLAKLRWLNAQHLRTLKPEALLKAARPFLGAAARAEGGKLAAILECLRDNIETLDQIAGYLPVFLDEFPPVEEAAREVLRPETAREVARAFRKEVESVDDASEQRFAAIIASIKKNLGVSGKALFMPIRAAMTGLTHGPELGKIYSLLPRQTLLARVARNPEA